MPEKEMPRVVIVDYEAGNLFSVEHACKTVGLKPAIVNKAADIINADALILPGVGAFGAAMKNLHRLDLVQPILDFTATGRPFLGVCLGMQILFSGSNEFGEHKGLNLIEGEVVKFPEANRNGERMKIPQIGWNRIFYPLSDVYKWSGTPLEKIANGEFMYFVHSYYANPSISDNILSTTDYGGIRYCSSVIKGNIFAVQFHPEKSAEEGIKIYRYWANQINNFVEN
ncbi:MAG: imidazole glycerol phosphate synthase subunit HisH [Pseudomonadota bacterium]